LPKHIHDKLPKTFAIPPELQEIAQVFREAQEKRHAADYDPSESFARADVLLLIQDVEQSLQPFEQIKDEPEMQFFLTCLLTWGILTRRK
ncbi:MAG TPA: hypothetical protein VGX76_10600, partial [Pirellulales bacterium]|nr:hypothetical protein [Pirellulales bacterium]